MSPEKCDIVLTKILSSLDPAFQENFCVFKGGFTYEALSNMKYLMMCFNESMRMYPPAIR